MAMAVVGARTNRHNIMAFPGMTAASSQQAIIAATQTFYHPPITSQDIQPDRPIGYGAFGVVWYVSKLYIYIYRYNFYHF